MRPTIPFADSVEPENRGAKALRLIWTFVAWTVAFSSVLAVAMLVR